MGKLKVKENFYTQMARYIEAILKMGSDMGKEFGEDRKTRSQILMKVNFEMI